MTNTYFAGKNSINDPKVGYTFSCCQQKYSRGNLVYDNVVTSEVTDVNSCDNCQIATTASGSTYVVISKPFLRKYLIGYVTRIPKIGHAMKARVVHHVGYPGEYIEKRCSTYNITSVTQVSENCYKVASEEGTNMYVIHQSLKS